jgi:HK97 gp10 family phage protein
MSAEISVTVSGIEELVTTLGTDFVEELKTNVGSTVQNLVNKILDEARILVPVRTGYLLSTIGGQQVNAWSFQIFARAPYAGYVEWGTHRMAARLYMTHAINMYAPEFAEDVDEAVVQSAQAAGLAVS